MLLTLVVVVAAVIVLPVAGLAILSATAARPANLGVTDGQLAPCPGTPNCVSTAATDDVHGIEPIRYDGVPDEAMARLRRILESCPRTRIISAHEHYLHAECTSRLFRFVDDVEFLIDPQQEIIHFRSASRVGKSDLGVNRERMEAIRHEFTADASSTP